MGTDPYGNSIESQLNNDKDIEIYGGGGSNMNGVGMGSKYGSNKNKSISGMDPAIKAMESAVNNMNIDLIDEI